MRILIVSQYFWPENFRINDIAVGLQEKGHQVTVLTGLPNYPEGKFYPEYSFFNKSTENWQGIEIIRAREFPRGRNQSWRLALNYISFVFFELALKFTIGFGYIEISKLSSQFVIISGSTSLNSGIYFLTYSHLESYCFSWRDGENI